MVNLTDGKIHTGGQASIAKDCTTYISERVARTENTFYLGLYRPEHKIFWSFDNNNIYFCDRDQSYHRYKRH